MALSSQKLARGTAVLAERGFGSELKVLRIISSCKIYKKKT